MKIHNETLSDVARYLENNKHVTLEDKESDFEYITDTIKEFKTLDEKTNVLEIGTGLGWFPILCKKNGIPCKGIEISPELIERAMEFGRRYGIEPDIELGNIEETDIGRSLYDVIIATSVFEHVEYWKVGIQRIYDVLKPDGVMYFYSTNKFSFTSGEFDFPLYGWLPDRLRFRLRKSRQGEDIMKLGIDFNQFTNFQLRRFFKKTGFSVIQDRVDLLDPHSLRDPKKWKTSVLKLLKKFRPLKHMALVLASGSVYVCVK